MTASPSARERPSLGRMVILLAGGEAVARVLTFISFVHLARALAPATYGLLELTLAATMFLTIAVEHGVAELGAREIARANPPVEPLAAGVVSSQVLSAAGLYALLAALVLVFPFDRTLRLLLLAYGLSAFGIPFLLSWVFQGRTQMGRVALLQVLRAAVFTAAVLLAVDAPEHVLRVPFAELGSIAVVAAASVLLLLLSGERLRVRFRSGTERWLWRDSLPIGGSKMIWALRMFLPIILLGTFSGQASVGRFGVAHRILMVGQTLLGVYFMAVFPIVSGLAGESTPKLARFVEDSVRLAHWGCAAVAVATSLAAPALVSLLFGAQYARGDGALTLAVLIWIVPILAWRRHARSTLIALNHQREELYCSLAGLALLVPLASLLSYSSGPAGTAGAMVLAELAATVLTWWRLRRHLPDLRLRRTFLGLPSLATLTRRGSYGTTDR